MATSLSWIRTQVLDCNWTRSRREREQAFRPWQALEAKRLSPSCSNPFLCQDTDAPAEWCGLFDNKEPVTASRLSSALLFHLHLTSFVAARSEFLGTFFFSPFLTSISTNFSFLLLNLVQCCCVIHALDCYKTQPNLAYFRPHLHVENFVASLPFLPFLPLLNLQRLRIRRYYSTPDQPHCLDV